MVVKDFNYYHLHMNTLTRLMLHGVWRAHSPLLREAGHQESGLTSYLLFGAVVMATVLLIWAHFIHFLGHSFAALCIFKLLLMTKSDSNLAHRQSIRPINQL